VWQGVARSASLAIHRRQAPRPCGHPFPFKRRSHVGQLRAYGGRLCAQSPRRCWCGVSRRFDAGAIAGASGRLLPAPAWARSHRCMAIRDVPRDCPFSLKRRGPAAAIGEHAVRSLLQVIQYRPIFLLPYLLVKPAAPRLRSRVAGTWANYPFAGPTDRSGEKSLACSRSTAAGEDSQFADMSPVEPVQPPREHGFPPPRGDRHAPLLD